MKSKKRSYSRKRTRRVGRKTKRKVSNRFKRSKVSKKKISYRKNTRRNTLRRQMLYGGLFCANRPKRSDRSQKQAIPEPDPVSKPVPAKAEPVSAKAEPVSAKAEPVPAKTEPVPAKEPEMWWCKLWPNCKYSYPSYNVVYRHEQTEHGLYPEYDHLNRI